MATYEVETDLMVICKVKVAVVADNASEAIEAAADLMPPVQLPWRQPRMEGHSQRQAAKGCESPRRQGLPL